MGKAVLRTVFLLIPICYFLFPTVEAQQVSVIDDRGTRVTLAAPAQRIVALSPHLAELAFAAGAGNRLVGAARHSDFPPAVRDLPQTGDAARVDFERVALLKPDLVLAWSSGNPAGDLARVEQLGFAVFVTEPARLADVPRLLRAIGELAGSRPAAEKAAAGFEREIATLRARNAHAARVRVFYQIWHKPLLTVNGAHVISDVIALCGGENVFADLSQLTPTISLESVLAARPEVILGGGSAGEARSELTAVPVVTSRAKAPKAEARTRFRRMVMIALLSLSLALGTLVALRFVMR